jgi:CII-binding regulator of phage lambda lysogenization HflD
MIIKDSIHNHYKTKESEMYTMSEMAGLMEDVCSKFAKKIAVL